MLLTQEAYEMKKNELEELKQKLKEVRREKAIAIRQADGDGRHDNFGFEQAEIQERAIIKDINDLTRKLGEVTIVEEKEHKNKVVQVGKIVKLEMDFGDGDTEVLELQLQALSSDKEGIVTLNSPIGRKIFQQEVDFVGECKLSSGNIVKIHILDIL